MSYLKVESYDREYFQGFLSQIVCTVYDTSAPEDKESFEYSVHPELFSLFIDEEDVEGYMNEQSFEHLCADLEVFINKQEKKNKAA